MANVSYLDIDKIIELTLALTEEGVCPNCNSDYSNGYCEGCHAKIEFKNKDAIDKLKTIIIDYNGDYDINNNIYVLRILHEFNSYFGLNFIEEFLDKFKFKDFIEQILLTLKNKINSGENLNLEEIATLGNYYCLFPKDKRDIFINYVIMNSGRNNINFPYQLVEDIIVDFTKKLMTCYISGPLCIVVENLKNARGDRVNGLTSEKVICLDKKEIEQLQQGIYNVIYTIFHEITHLKQLSNMRDVNNITYQMLKITKELILKEVFLDYSHDNYDIVSYEVEARISEMITTNRYFNTFGFKMTNEDDLKNEIIKEQAKQNNNDRIIEGKVVDLYDYFDNFISDKPYLLEEYPQLQIEYLFDEKLGLIRPKNIDELNCDCKVFNSYDCQLYEELIKKAKRKLPTLSETPNSPKKYKK